MKKRFFLTLIAVLLLLTNVNMVTNAVTIFDDELLEDEEDALIEQTDVVDFDIENLKVDARNAIAIDGNTNQVLYEQNSQEVVSMASTTKILTALVVLNENNLDKEIEISKNAASIRGSTVGYSAGEKIKIKELLFGLMFRSGNDAAIALAEGTAGSIENFAKIMNQFAKSLGLTNSNFESPHGLDSAKHYSCAYDLAILTAKAMENELFKEICSTKDISREKYGFTRDYHNINKILWKIENANGVKTGYTGQAGKCLVTSVRHDDRNVIIVVLNCYDRWNQTDRIYKYVEANYQFTNLKNNEILKSSSVQNLGSIIEDEEFQYGFKEEAMFDIEVFNPIDNIEKGDIIGKITLKENDNIILKQELKSNKHIRESKFLKEYINKEDAEKL